MNRLQRKCVIASAGFHLFLVLLLLIGPAFLSSRTKPDDMTVLDFVPVKTVDAMMSGGGNPRAQPPAPAPPAPQPAAQPAAPPPQPAPPKPAVKSEPAVKETVKSDPESLEVTKERRHKVEVSTTLVKRRTDDGAEAKARSEAQAREAAEARRATAAAIGRAVAGIQGGLSGSTTIELKGPGGGGVPYANWLQAVNSTYQRAWDVPSSLDENTPAVAASITIGRDGSVISARIIRSSGNSAADQSVQVTLERVRRVPPLPDEAQEDQRTVTINFINDKARRLLG